MAGLSTGAGAPVVMVYHEKSMILPDVSRVLACLYEKDVKFECVKDSYKDIVRLQASRSVPVPFYDGPTFLQESRAICRYIAETYKQRGYPFLLGKDVLERASIEQWLRHEEHAFNPPSRALFCHLAFPLHDEDDDNINREKRKLEEVLGVYEQRLGESEFLAGNKFTLADLVHLPNTHHILLSEKFAYLYDSRKNMQRWWNTISARDSWQQVLRDMKSVKEQYQMEEYEQQQQQQRQKESPPTYGGSNIRIDSRMHTGTESQTILIPPPSTGFIATSVSSVQQEEQPPPAKTTSHDKSSPIQQNESNLFTTTEKTPTTTKTPPRTETDKSSTKDASSPTKPSQTSSKEAPIPQASKTSNGIHDSEAVAPDKPSLTSAKAPHKTDEPDFYETESKPASVGPWVDKPVSYTKPDPQTSKTPYTRPPAQRDADTSSPEAGETPSDQRSDDTTKKPAVDTKAAPTPPRQEPVSSSQLTTEQIKGVAPTSHGITGDESAKIAMADESATPPAPASDGRVASTALKGGILDARGKNEAVASVADPTGMPTTPRRPARTPDTQHRTTSDQASDQAPPFPSFAETRKKTGIAEAGQTNMIAPDEQPGERILKNAGEPAAWPSPMKSQKNMNEAYNDGPSIQQLSSDQSRAQLAENKKQGDDATSLTEIGKPKEDDFLANANQNNTGQAQVTSTDGPSKLQMQSDQNKPISSKDIGKQTNETVSYESTATSRQMLPLVPEKSMRENQLQDDTSSISLQDNVKQGSEAALSVSGTEQPKKRELLANVDQNSGKTPGEAIQKSEERTSSDTQQVKSNTSNSKSDDSSKPTQFDGNEGNLPESQRRGSSTSP